MRQQKMIPRLVISASGSGGGKTTFTLGLLQALIERGLLVQPYKVGPDYIDPAFHTRIAGRNSINLDGWLLEEEDIKRIFAMYAKDADISIVEGVMGLYDGFQSDPLWGSTAGISKILQSPVILVLQAKGMSATAAAILQGLIDFKNVQIAGVVINQPSSENHYRILKRAIEEHTPIKVLGYLPNTESISLKSRHLGLVQSCEIHDLERKIQDLGRIVEEYVDIDSILKIANETCLFSAETFDASVTVKRKVKIAVAFDAAFNFYYYENLQMLKRLGAELVFFSPLKEDGIPDDCSGMYIGGGYPEVFAEALHENHGLKRQIRQKADEGFPIYAECGGYIYLNNGFTAEDGMHYEFAGVFNGETVLTRSLQHFGYVEIQSVRNQYLFDLNAKMKAHEFHKSTIIRQDEPYAIKAKKIRNGKAEEWYCGMHKNNVFAMYPHLYFPSCTYVAENFVNQCIAYKAFSKK